MCEDGWEYRQRHDSAEFTRGAEVVQLRRRGALWVEEGQPTLQEQLKEACLAFLAETQECLASVDSEVSACIATTLGRGSQGHCRAGHLPHDPKCADCVRARMRHHYKRRRKARVVEGPSRGLRLSADLMGPFEPELMAHVYSLMVVDDESRWAAVGGLKDKSSAAASTTFNDLVLEIKQFTDRIGECIARVHTDMGSEFKGAFEALCKQLEARHTGTGGYASESNPLAEQWNKMAQESLRAMLAACTGGVGYFDQLWHT